MSDIINGLVAGAVSNTVTNYMELWDMQSPPLCQKYFSTCYTEFGSISSSIGNMRVQIEIHLMYGVALTIRLS